MRPITAIAPANIAFIKYWGRTDHNRYIPANHSLSVTIDQCTTTTTVSSNDSPTDQVFTKYFQQSPIELKPDSRKNKALFDHIHRLKQYYKYHQPLQIISQNSFPSDAGIAASASAFCSLTTALITFASGIPATQDRRQLSYQTRLAGSGSAVRSAYGGFVALKAGTDQDSIAYQIADEHHWDLVDIIAIVDPGKKSVSSSQGHEIAATSPFHQSRLDTVQNLYHLAVEGIRQKDIEKLGTATEADCHLTHAVMQTSTPPALYWNAGTMDIIHTIRELRLIKGIPVYYTFDAGPNGHCLTQAKYAPKVKQVLESLPSVQWTITNHPAPGAALVDSHLDPADFVVS